MRLDTVSTLVTTEYSHSYGKTNHPEKQRLTGEVNSAQGHIDKTQMPLAFEFRPDTPTSGLPPPNTGGVIPKESYFTNDEQLGIFSPIFSETPSSCLNTDCSLREKQARDTLVVITSGIRVSYRQFHKVAWVKELQE